MHDEGRCVGEDEVVDVGVLERVVSIVVRSIRYENDTEEAREGKEGETERGSGRR